MNLWRLEALRLIRTRRLVALVGIYVFFGIVGPLTARYLGEILERFGGDVVIQFPDPVPADGIAQYVSNVSQIGVLVAVAVAAGALTLDALPEMSIFLRTRVRSVRAMVIPRYAVITGAAVGAYLVGLLAAWYETAVLLGGLDIDGMMLGFVFAALYLAFAAALVAAIGARVPSVLGTVGFSVVVLLVMPAVGVVESLGRWLPSHLVGAQVALQTGVGATDYLGAAGVTIALTALLVTTAIRTASTREL